MTADLRERLMAIAAYPVLGTAMSPHEIAIAAYRMAIEDAARACDDIASALPRRTLERTEAFRCAAAVRALAEGL